MSDPVIRFQDVVKRYGDVTALDRLSFTVRAKGCLGLLGPNGAGKTTALKCLLNLTAADGGEITCRAGSIGYLPQQPAVYGWMTAEEYLGFVGASRGLTGLELKAAVASALERLDLAKARRRRTSGFSGGMKQRLGIAAALIQDPDVLVLDEPVSALDPIGRFEILGLIDALKVSRCVIMSTHILDDAERVCDDVVILRDGKAILQQTMDGLRAELAPQFEVEIPADETYLAELAGLAEQQDWVTAAWVKGGVVIVAVQDADADMPKLLEFLARESDRASRPIVRIERSKVSLEDVFLQVVRGR